MTFPLESSSSNGATRDMTKHPISDDDTDSSREGSAPIAPALHISSSCLFQEMHPSNYCFDAFIILEHNAEQLLFKNKNSFTSFFFLLKLLHLIRNGYVIRFKRCIEKC